MRGRAYSPALPDLTLLLTLPSPILHPPTPSPILTLAPPPSVQVVGFAVGYVEQSFRLTFYIAAAGLAVAAVVCVPDWPWFNRNPMPWQTPVKTEEVVEGEGEVAVAAEEEVVVEEVEEAEELKKEGVGLKKKSKKKKAGATAK